MRSFTKKTLVKLNYLNYLLIAALLCSGIQILSSGLYIQLKAKIAQALIEVAWKRSLSQPQALAPWPWADTSVVGVIYIKDKAHFVLAGESGRNLAFGPTLMNQSASLNSHGNSVIAAHNDTQFSVLKNVAKGEIVKVDTADKQIRYRVIEKAIVHQRELGILAPTKGAALTLISCYPFNSSGASTQLRMVVRAVPA